MTEFDALRKANELNLTAIKDGKPERYWTVLVLYNWVIWRTETGRLEDGVMCEV